MKIYTLGTFSILLILILSGCSQKEVCHPNIMDKDTSQINCNVDNVLWKVENTCDYDSRAVHCYKEED